MILLIHNKLRYILGEICWVYFGLLFLKFNVAKKCNLSSCFMGVDTFTFFKIMVHKIFSDWKPITFGKKNKKLEHKKVDIILYSTMNSYKNQLTPARCILIFHKRWCRVQYSTCIWPFFVQSCRNQTEYNLLCLSYIFSSMQKTFNNNFK